MRLRPIFVLWAFSFLVACSTDQCSCTGYEQRAFPSRALDATVPAAGQARVTASGLKFVEAQVPYLIDQFLPGGLNFCIPQDTSGNPDICVASTCPSGAAGCPIDLTIVDQHIIPKPPNELEVSITIGDVDDRLNFDYGTFVGTVNCYVQLFKKGSSEATAAEVVGTIPIGLNVDGASPTKELRVDVGEAVVNLDDVDFKIHGRGNVGDTIACEGAGLVRGLFRGMIESEIRKILKDTVGGIADEQLCRRCGTGFDACSTGACEDGICRYPSDICVPRPMGAEGRLNLGSLLAPYTEEPNASVDVLVKAGDLAKVDTGVSVGLRAGFEPNAFAQCIPVDPTKRPSSAAVPLSTVINADRDPDNQPFHLGIGIHKRAIEHMLWSTWASGAACLNVGSETVMLLSTGTFQLAVPSLKDIGPSGRTATLVVVPQKAPTIELGANTITQANGSYTISEPLLILKWPDLDFHVFGYAQDRMLRLFSIRVDLELPVALSPDGDGNLIPVMGAIEDAIRNVRPRRTELIAEGPQRILDLVPTLIGFAAPQLASAIPESIAIPEFLGFRLDLQQGDVRGADGNDFLAAFATLARTTQAFTLGVDTFVSQVELDMTNRSPSGLVRPRIDLRAGGLGLDLAPIATEFQWRVDGGFWSMFHAGPELSITNPVLSLPGIHRIEVRARIVSEPTSLDRSPATFEVTIEEPTPVLTPIASTDAADDVDTAIIDHLETSSDPPKVDRAGGCSSIDAGAGWWLPILGLFMWRRRRSSLGFLPILCVVLFWGCKGDVTTNATTRCFGPECSVDQACGVDADCNGICPAGTTGICEADKCQCVRACDGGCKENEFCCIGSSACVPSAPTCDQACEAGYESRVVGTPNRETCEVDGGACQCLPLPPIPIGVHGQQLSVDSKAGVTVVATYNRTYGDLMIGRLEADGALTWQFVDGMPTSGAITGDPTGWRGGREERGPNVGTHSAVAIDDGGMIHMVYRDEDAKGLKYARGVFGSAFETGILEADGDPLWVSAVLIGTELHVIYGVDGVAGKSILRHATLSISGPVEGAASFITVAEANVDATQSKDFLRRQGMFGDLSSTPQGGLLAVWYDGISRRIGRSVFDGTWAEPTYLAVGTGPYAAGAVDAEGLVHLAFMSGNGLRYSRFGGELRTSLIHDGRRDGGEYYAGPIGEDVDIRVGAGDSVRVVFQDAFDHALYEAKWNSESFDLSKVPLPPNEAGGFYVTFSRDSDFFADWLVDRTQEPWGRVRVLPLSL